jgi:5'(3')-deoxyribonucleotidase
MTEPIIYLDMDGVCCDFVGSAVKIHGLNRDEIMATWAADYPGEFYPYRVLDMPRDHFWEKVSEKSEEFWVELEEYEWFTHLYESLESMAKVVFLSSPTRSPFSLSGKLHWLQARFGREFREFILTPQKHLLAKPHAILIDDFDWNVNSFKEHGGGAVLFPQIWNENHLFKEEPAQYTIEQVKNWKDSLS